MSHLAYIRNSMQNPKREGPIGGKPAHHHVENQVHPRGGVSEKPRYCAANLKWTCAKHRFRLIWLADAEGFIPLIEEKELNEGTMRLVRAEGKPVLFIKQNGKIYVIDDRCPHMGCRLSGGNLDGGLIVCPCHDWRFNLDTGEYENQPAYKLVTYPFKVEAGKIWVKIEEDDL
jgi:nitrite reductase/ring-hydroxylating ferredoxin subunit